MRSFHIFAMRFVVTTQVNPSSSTEFPHPVRPNPLPHSVTCDTTEVEAAQANCIARVHGSTLMGLPPTRTAVAATMRKFGIGSSRRAVEWRQ
jgi:hypothetical protein